MSEAASGPLILLNEDDPDTREALTALLVDEGYATAFCPTIEVAREYLKRHDAVLLLDLNARGSSLTALDWLQDFLARGDAPRTMIVSGSTGAQQLAERFGIRLVRKPFSIESLVEEITRLSASNARPSDGGAPSQQER